MLAQPPEANLPAGISRSNHSPEAIANAVPSLANKPLGCRINILVARLCFRGIYFPQMGMLAWAKVISQNGQTIRDIAKEGLRGWFTGLCKEPSRSIAANMYGD